MAVLPGILSADLPIWCDEQPIGEIESLLPDSAEVIKAQAGERCRIIAVRPYLAAVCSYDALSTSLPHLVTNYASDLAQTAVFLRRRLQQWQM